MAAPPRGLLAAPAIRAALNAVHRAPRAIYRFAATAVPPRGLLAAPPIRAALNAVHRAPMAIYRFAATAVPPRGRLPALYALLAALWVANARTIAMAAERCLRVDGRPMDDELCRNFVGPPVPLVALFMLRVIWHREAEAWEDWVAAGRGALPALDEPAPAPEQAERPRRLVSESSRERDIKDAALVGALFVSFALQCLMISVSRRAVAWFSSHHELYLVYSLPLTMSYIFAQVAYLIVAVFSCFLTIPYVVLRLRRVQREMGMGMATA